MGNLLHRPVTSTETDPNILRSTPYSVFLFSCQGCKYFIASQRTRLKLRTVYVLKWGSVVVKALRY